MTFLAPWLLLALAALPILWWLLRVTPPAPRRQAFPPARLLLSLPSAQTPSRTPAWLLALRLAAAGALILGVAGPVLGARHSLPGGGGPLAIVLDDGWATAADWTIRAAAVDLLAAEADRTGRSVTLLTTAPDDDGNAPRLRGPMTGRDLQAVLPTLRPHPWPTDRSAAATALQAAGQAGAVAYVSDGLSGGSQWLGFARALQAVGPVTVVATAVPTGEVLSATSTATGWTVRLGRAAAPVAITRGVRAEASDGRILAHANLTIPPGAGSAATTLSLPTELRNRVDRLSLETADGSAVPAAATVAVLDEADRRRPVGLLLADTPAANTPLTGTGYFLNRALADVSEWRQGSLEALLARPLAVLLAPDRPMPPGAETERLRDWVEHGGTLIRFAGPDVAQAAQDGQPDSLLPAPLLPADRQMGGSMSWSQPATLAAFPPGSPFADLAVTGDIHVSRQVLADPEADLTTATWARLTDGTPLVTQRPMGAGRVVLFHVTANADWSDLPLAGLFVDMLRHLLALSSGVATEGGGTGSLTPARMLDAFGNWAAPNAAAQAIDAREFPVVVAGPHHPPGLYGPEGGRRVLNLSQGLADPVAAPELSNAHTEILAATAAPRPLGPLLVALAALLLVVDLLASLRARGLLGAAAASMLVLALAAVPLPASAASYDAALATRLAYVVTGDAAVDEVSRAGLSGLSGYVNERTAAELAEPVAVVPGRDDLTFYPLLYWPLSGSAPAPDAAMLGALNAYMAGGGVVLIDTRDGNGGPGMDGGAREVLRRLGSSGDAVALAAPPLAPLTSTHVLARSFYLLSDFPGRYDGDTVWIARDTDRSNDSVSPVIIGGEDWAAAWAVDDTGQHPYATLPGGERQRTMAYRFGVNLVMYSLTGNYKGDQVHVPALLQRLGQ